jgi:hypothetical protein
MPAAHAKPHGVQGALRDTARKNVQLTACARGAEARSNFLRHALAMHIPPRAEVAQEPPPLYE